MNAAHPISLFWKQAPFLRLILPFIAGIVIQQHNHICIEILAAIATLLAVSLIFLNTRSIASRFFHSTFQGLLFNLLLVAIGMIVATLHYLPSHKKFIGNCYKNEGLIIATIKETVSEKANSFRTIVDAQEIAQSNDCVEITGKILIYFEKNNSVATLQPGDQIIFSASLQSIKNTGNPGGFDFKKYNQLKNIFHQAYLKTTAWRLIEKGSTINIDRILAGIQQKILSIIKKFISSEKEQGLAEALLIGYKDDLDKELVQSYSNTGVVHVIAISGLHLGLIYWLFSLFLKPLERSTKYKWIRPLIIIISLWVFSLLAGASPSVLRSAVMFSFIVIGQFQNRKISIYNSLAASAFLLLFIDPFWLWDVGFQLSYIAVLSIVIFMKPIYNLVFIENKLLDTIWQLSSVTIAAQILTTPISLYYFHQFPITFLITNMLAIPLSSIILLGEILLIVVSFIQPLAKFIGILLQKSVWLLNSFIEYMSHFPFALWENILVSFTQVIFLYLIIIFCYSWLHEKRKISFYFFLSCLTIFFGLRSASFIQSQLQEKLVVYNIPRQQAVELIFGNSYSFLGNPFLLNADIKSSRTIHRSYHSLSLKEFNENGFVLSSSKSILIVDSNQIPILPNPIYTDIVILSNNPSISIHSLKKVIHFSQIVIDCSNSARNARQWTLQCQSFNIPCHNVSIDGAFVMNLSSLTFAPR